jgi:hypothetical protein
MKSLRALLILILVGSPILFWLVIWRPAQSHMNANLARIAEARAQLQELPRYTPLSAEETTFLENPAARWRERIPLVQGDQDRLAHYHRVVTEVDQAFRRRGLKTHGMRSSWKAIHASFTLDRELGPALSGEASPASQSDGSLAAWVLEVQLDGPTDGLFTGLEQLGTIPPLLEPVGFRWEASPERRSQSLWLRNLVLVPNDGVR